MIEVSSEDDKLELISNIELNLKLIIENTNNWNYTESCVSIVEELNVLNNLIKDDKERIVSILNKLQNPYLSWLYSFSAACEYTDLVKIIDNSHLRERITPVTFSPLLW